MTKKTSSKPDEETDAQTKSAFEQVAESDGSSGGTDGARKSTPPTEASHVSELEAAATLREPEKKPKRVAEPAQRSREIRAPAPTPQRSSDGLESVVSTNESTSEPKTEREENESSANDDRLERRVRSVRPEDVQRMRTLAERVYHQGWNKLSGEEQQAFLYHSRFLEYLSEQERTRPDIQSTMYRFVGAQGKSLGLTSTYTARDINLLTERFFDQISTPFNRPDMYRAPANTDYFKGNERKN